MTQRRLDMNKTRSRTIVHLMAALFLAGVLVPAFVTAQEAQPPQAGRRPAAKMAPREDLGLTPEQQKSLQEFRKARMEEGRAFREEMMKMRGEMRELAKDPKANEAKINGLIDKMAKAGAERAKTAFKDRAQLEKIFTPEQLEKLKTFRNRRMGRAGLAGRGRMGMGRMGMPGRGMGRSFERPGLGMRPMGRFRRMNRMPFFWWLWAW
jgi:Spy/CpxP family protein refolding chaperone